MERYCDDRSAEYEWRVTRGGGGTVFKQCFLYGSPELASDWRTRSNTFHPQCPGGVMALYPRHGWSFIRIPGEDFMFVYFPLCSVWFSFAVSLSVRCAALQPAVVCNGQPDAM